MSDALSRKEEDAPQGPDDQRVSHREAVLFPYECDDTKIKPPVISTFVFTNDPVDLARTRVFENDDLHNEWAHGIASDNDYEQIRQAITDQDTTRFPADLRLRFTAQMSDCALNSSGVPTYRGRLWLPDHEPLRTKVIQRVHDDSSTGHPGRDGTISLMRRTYFWPGMSQDVRRFVANCDVCGKSKIWRQKKHGLLQPLEIPDRPWSGISADFMTHLPKSEGCENLMVITCRLTGAVILEPLPRVDVDTVTRHFLSCFYRHHGPPRWIVSDRGSQWVNGFWERFCALVGIERKLPTSHHPQTDGATERANQEVQAYLRAFMNWSQQDWYSRVASAQLAINNRDTARGPSPFFATHGYNVDPIQLRDEDMEAAPGSRKGNAESLVRKLRDTNDWIASAIGAMQERMEQQAKREASEELRVGDEVWLDELNTPRGIYNRFHADLLRKCATNPFPSQKRHESQPPAVTDEDGEEVYEVEEVLEGTEALDAWEAKYGPIEANDGPREAIVKNKKRRGGAARKRGGNVTG